MLMLLGYLMVATFMVLIMTRRLSALVALTLIPLLFGMFAGHGRDLGEMAIAGITTLAPTAALLLFAVLYFAIMIDAGLFDPLVNRVLRFAGDDPVRVVLGSAVVALLVALDGDGATTALILFTAFLPVYRRLKINPLILAVIMGSSGTVMSLTPWGGPLGRAAAALHIDPSSIFLPLVPTWISGIVGTLLIAWHLGRRERRRIDAGVVGTLQTVSEVTFDRDASLTRPQLILINFVLTLLVVAAAIVRFVPLPLVFMVGLSIALMVNYPNLALQRQRLKAHSENAMPIVLLIFGAGVFTGILQGTGMVDAMAKGAMAAVPPALGPHLGVVTAFLSIPLTFVLSNDAYYFGVMPVIAQTAAHYGVEPAVIARASLLGQPTHGLSPLVAAFYLIVGLVGCEPGALQRFGLKWALLLVMILIATATLTSALG